MSRLEHQTTDIMNVMFDSVTNDNFDGVSDDIDAVDNGYDKTDTDNEQMPYDNDNEQMPYDYDNDNDTPTGEMKYDRNMTNELKDIGMKDTVPYKRDDNVMAKAKWSIETSDISNDFMREYDNMCKSMEDRQINDFYEARRHIQSTMMGDTPVKTMQNRQCIDNVSDYDSEHYRISKSVCHRLDLRPNMLPGAQQHTTVESAAAFKIQDKIKGKYNENMQSNNGQYRNEMYKRAANMIPQLDGTFNISDNSDSDSHSYLDLAGINIKDGEKMHQIEPESELTATDNHSLHPYVNNDIEHGLFEDIVDSYYLDSQIKDDFQCDHDCYSQHRDPTIDVHSNTCTHDYHHITQSVQDLSDSTQPNNLHSIEENTSSFADDTTTLCDFGIVDHHSEMENTNDTNTYFPPKQPDIHPQRKHAYRNTFGESNIQYHDFDNQDSL